MIIYDCNGCYKNNPLDVHFGWWLCNPEIEENESGKQKIVEEKKITPEEESLVDIADLTCEIRKNPSVIIKYEPKIKIYNVKSVDLSQLVVEGVFNHNKMKSTVVESFKQQLVNIINYSTLEGKLLLSVVHNAMYKRLFETEKKNYNENNETLSKLILANPLEAITEDTIIVNKAERKNSNAADADNNESYRKNFMKFDRNRSKLLKCTGIGMDIDKSLRKFSDRTYEIQTQLSQIRKCFREEEIRINKLIKEAIALRRNINETSYLDELLYLLNEKPEKLKSKQWPFRLGSHNSKNKLNLII